MLSTAAFNALLKTLEEPPPHVKFIFATTEVQKIPITILSRCQRFDFAGIGIAADRRAAASKSSAAEGMQADDDALELVARRAGGSMRDAQSLLDQLLAFGGEKLTVEQVHQLLGTADDDRVAGAGRRDRRQGSEEGLGAARRVLGDRAAAGRTARSAHRLLARPDGRSTAPARSLPTFPWRTRAAPRPSLTRSRSRSTRFWLASTCSPPPKPVCAAVTTAWCYWR